MNNFKLIGFISAFFQLALIGIHFVSIRPLIVFMEGTSILVHHTKAIEGLGTI